LAGVSENLELARRAFDAIRRRDLDALLELMDPEVVAVPRILAVEGGALHGHHGVRRWWESIFGVFPDFDIEVVGIRAVRDWTISELRVQGRGEGSDTPFEDAIWVASRARDGKAVLWRTLTSEAEAAEATEPGG
jgi:ketosteroid isomerase-like protein